MALSAKTDYKGIRDCPPSVLSRVKRYSLIRGDTLRMSRFCTAATGVYMQLYADPVPLIAEVNHLCRATQYSVKPFHTGKFGPYTHCPPEGGDGHRPARRSGNSYNQCLPTRINSCGTTATWPMDGGEPRREENTPTKQTEQTQRRNLRTMNHTTRINEVLSGQECEVPSARRSSPKARAFRV